MSYVIMFISFMCGAMFGIGVAEDCNIAKIIALVFYVAFGVIFRLCED